MESVGGSATSMSFSAAVVAGVVDVDAPPKKDITRYLPARATA